MQGFIIRDATDIVISKVYQVLSCDASERLAGERTLQFVAQLTDGLEKMKEEESYTVEFEDDLYDVVSFQKSMNGNLCLIDISCEHVSYRLNEYKLENFSQTGTGRNILIELLKNTGFVVSTDAPSLVTTYSSQQSASVRGVLLDFAGTYGFDVDFHRFTVSVIPHKGEVKDTKIIQQNVIEIRKTINVTDNSTSFSLRMKPKCRIGVGDEVHLVFDRLGIDDKVRVLGIKRQPFISENITLEVGAYAPDLESDSVRVLTDFISRNETYYGTKISSDNGIEVNRGDGQAKVVFNADKMAFYQGNEEILFFDPAAKKWKMSAAVEVHISDSEGNDTTISAVADGLTTRIQDADNHYVEISETLNGFTVKNQEGETLIDGGMIITDNMQLHRLIAKGSPNSYVEMLTNGLNFVLGNANTIGIGYASDKIPLPYIIFGEGASPKSDESGMIKFYSGGLWMGDSADRHATEITSGTGLFVDVPNDKIYLYINGERSEVSNQTNVAQLISNLRDYVDQRFIDFKPNAVFG